MAIDFKKYSNFSTKEKEEHWEEIFKQAKFTPNLIKVGAYYVHDRCPNTIYLGIYIQDLGAKRLLVVKTNDNTFGKTVNPSNFTFWYGFKEFDPADPANKGLVK